MPIILFAFQGVNERDIPQLIVRVLLNIHTGQQIRALWNDAYSNSFCVSNGVKLGAILIPLLFCVYYDTLLLKLRSKGVGCLEGGLLLSALAHADDVELLAPSSNVMRQMLSVL